MNLSTSPAAGDRLGDVAWGEALGHARSGDRVHLQVGAASARANGQREASLVDLLTFDGKRPSSTRPLTLKHTYLGTHEGERLGSNLISTRPTNPKAAR